MNNFIAPLCTALALLLGLSLSAQIRTPMPSPTAEFEQRLGLSSVSMEYSRPGVKGRDIFGDLVPYGQIWRTGANAATTITFGEKVMLEGNEVEAGTYAIYTIPGEQEWTVMLYTDLSLGGNVANYDEENEYLRFQVESQELPMMFETMTFLINDIQDDQAILNLMWAKTLVSMEIKLNVDEQVMASIEQVMNGPSPNDYFAAARYYYETDRDMEQALEWINMTLESAERYWIMTWKARILGKMERYKEAMATSEKAKEMAQEAKNMDYVRMNDEMMAEFKAKM
jgi:tetratricopeptide (TPR) repeat protein